MSALRIGRMLPADIPAVLAIEADSPETSSWDEAMLRGELERSWAYVWVARTGGGDAADPAERPKLAEAVFAEDDAGRGAGAVAFLATWLVQDELHVLNVATHPAHRRRGYARALLDHGLSFGREHGVRMVLLEVRRSNGHAIALYRSLGFSAIGLRERYYGNSEDAVEMVLRLDPETGRVIPGADEVRLG